MYGHESTTREGWCNTLLVKCRDLPNHLPRAHITDNFTVTPFTVLAGTVACILVYGYFVKPHIFDTDPLRTNFAPCCGCDYWALLHVALYFVLGYLFPGHGTAFAGVGIGWEFYECVSRWFEIQRIFMPTLSPEKYWYGRVSDVAFNAVGLLAGEIVEWVVRSCRRAAVARTIV